MRIVRTSFIAAALLLLAGVAQASDPFYSTLLIRGIADSQRGDSFRAAKELRIAAFGLVDEPAQYLRAQVYLAHAYEKLNQRADATVAVEKASRAERISATYSTTAIDPDTRSAFEALAVKLLRPEQLALVPAFKGRVVGQAPPPVVAKPPVVAQQPSPVVAKPPVVKPPVGAQAPSPVPSSTPTRQTPLEPAKSPAPIVVAKPPVGAQAPSPVPSSTTNRQTPLEPAKSPAPIVVASPAPIAVASPAPIGKNPPAPIAAPQPASPLVTAARHQPSASAAAGDASQQISEAQRMLNEGKILAARQIYTRLAQTEGLPRTTSLDVAKGLNQTSAWRESSASYQKLMPFRSGEELHQFYEAVNKYELGDVNSARDLMTRALPALPVTRETSLYKAKILGTQ